MSAQSTRRLQNSGATTFRSRATLSRIFCSIAGVGYSCSKVTGNRSRNASLSTLVPIKRPSSLPLPLVLAVAKIWNPSAGFTNLPIFFRKTPLPSKTDWRQRILLEARSISSRSNTAPRWSASITGPLCQTVSPLMRRKPPIRSSSSVSIVMFTRMSSLPVWAHACSTEKVLPLPDNPVIKVG